jgi:DNA polymerase-3 subunit gamma/tau
MRVGAALFPENHVVKRHMAESAAQQKYVVLATKYRPQRFEDLVGQDVLVRTLRNAIRYDRIANAFIMTGIRGVGKTTTARIIARALNCIGEEAQGKPTASPCGVCANCVAIRESRHPDVLEMDAASRTGVDDVREIIDMANYMPSAARYKVFIIDEVHMLSRNAFNALLKTLEEPPAHVKFVFATTEIRKVPVTVLSRCQRFDLKRLEGAELAAHLKRVCEQEGRSVADGALNVIAQAAEGSARDALSLLDQALSMQQGEPDEQSVRTMLGMADNGRTVSLFAALCEGNSEEALRIAGGMASDGIEPPHIVRELQQATHAASVMASVGPQADAGGYYDAQTRQKLASLAQAAGVAFLTRMWSLLVKGAEEFAHSYHARATLEMVLIRVCHASALPTPDALIRRLTQDASPQGAPVSFVDPDKKKALTAP